MRVSTIVLVVLLGVVLVAVVLLFQSPFGDTGGPDRTLSQRNLKQIGQALYGHHDTFKHLPSHATYSKDGKTALLSWRVTILPYLEEANLYHQFKLDEPWDSEHNKTLIAKVPMYYFPVGLGKTDQGLTYYQVFTGPGTLFDGTKKTRFSDIKRGLGNTILVIEAKDPVIWTKPADIVLPRDREAMPAVGGLFQDGAHAVFCDGTVRFLRRDLSPAVLRSMALPNGEAADQEKLDE